MGHSALTEQNVPTWQGRAAGGPRHLYTQAHTQLHTLHGRWPVTIQTETAAAQLEFKLWLHNNYNDIYSCM